MGEVLEDRRGAKANEKTAVCILSYHITLVLYVALLTIFRKQYYERTNSLIQQCMYNPIGEYYALETLPDRGLVLHSLYETA